jgi:hypothetical protein
LTPPGEFAMMLRCFHLPQSGFCMLRPLRKWPTEQYDSPMTHAEHRSGRPQPGRPRSSCGCKEARCRPAFPCALGACAAPPHLGVVVVVVLLAHASPVQPALAYPPSSTLRTTPPPRRSPRPTGTSR